MLDPYEILFGSDSESEFSGFGDSDLEIDVHHEESTDDESDDEAIRPNQEWNNNFSEILTEDFTEDPGPKLPDTLDPEVATPIQYFFLLFTEELIASIVDSTNTYFRWKMAQPGTAFDDSWEDVTIEEMRAFLAINILMGICQLPQTPMFWSTDSFLGNSGIRNTMTCNRFQKMMQYLHVADRESEPGRASPNYDRLFKIRPVMETLSRTFRQFYTLRREVTIDEAMIAFSGRLSFRQYMPAKPVKRGIKVWMMCDAKTSFLARFEVYLGRKEQTEFGLGHNIVTKLSDYLQHSFRWLFFDNFFTSVPLMESLLDKGLYACGTVRANRVGFPQVLKKPTDMKVRGSSKVLQKGDTPLTASVWRDKRLVHTLSTLSDPRTIVTANRRVREDILDVDQPHAVCLYNEYMGGVDHHDQHRSKYSVGRQAKKSWKYIFWFMLNSAIVNSFIMYRDASSRTTKKKRFTHLDFRMELVHELIAGFTKRKRAAYEGVHIPRTVPQENMDGHVNVRLPKRSSCKHHARVLKQRKDTVFGCSVCNVNLCKECHRSFHRQGAV